MQEQEPMSNKITQNNAITSQAETILKRRRKKYFQNVVLAKQVNDRKNAIEWLNIVKQFDTALGLEQFQAC